MKNKKQILKLLILPVLFLFTALQYTEVSAAAEMISRFCNEEKPTNSVLIEFDGTEEKEVCINVGNYGDMDGTAFLYFTDGEVNKANSIVCRDEGDEKKNLAKYIYLEDENDENNKLEKIAINLPIGKKAQIKGKIKLPAGYNGISYGCLITTSGVPNSTPGAVTVALRRSSTIIAKVSGKINVVNNFHESFTEDELDTEDDNINNDIAKEVDPVAPIRIAKNDIKDTSIFKADLSTIGIKKAVEPDLNMKNTGFKESIKGIFEAKDLENNVEIRHEGPITITIKRDFITMFVESFSEGVKNAFASLFNI